MITILAKVFSNSNNGSVCGINTLGFLQFLKAFSKSTFLVPSHFSLELKLFEPFFGKYYFK